MALLSYEDMALEYMKCYEDKSRIYFIEHYLSTFNADVRKTTPFLLFPRQKVFLRTVAEKPNTIAIKHRQCGITTVSSAWITGQFVFCDSDSKETVLAVANKLDLSVQIVDKIRDFLKQIPRFFWGDEYYSPDPNSPKNKKSIFVRDSKQELELFNGCKVFARSSGENASRGISAASILIFDEASFIENGTSVYASAVAASSSVKDAKIIMVSTPNGKDPLYYQTYRKATLGENNFTPVEFKWYQDLRYNRRLKWYKKDKETGETIWDEDDVIDDDGNILYDEKRWEDLCHRGYKPTSPWYEEMCKSFNNDSIKIAQELDVSFLGSSDNVVDPSVIEMHETVNVREPLEDFKDPLIEETWFWKRPIEGHRYLLACDPSSGSAADRTAIEVIDMDGEDENGFPILEQVMEYNGKQYGDVVGEMIFQYAQLYNNAFVVIECIGGYGDTVALTLMNLGYKNLFYEDKDLNKYTMKTLQNKYNANDYDRLPGFRNTAVRFQMLSHFAIMLRNNEFKIRSKRVIGELETWVFKEGSNRMDHLDSAHDDLITCLAMGLFVLRYSILRIQATKQKDEAILKSYIITNNNISSRTNYSNNTSLNIRGDGKRNKPLPFYTQRTLHKPNVNGNFMWLLSSYR